MLPIVDVGCIYNILEYGLFYVQEKYMNDELCSRTARLNKARVH